MTESGRIECCRSCTSRRSASPPTASARRTVCMDALDPTPLPPRASRIRRFSATPRCSACGSRGVARDLRIRGRSAERNPQPRSRSMTRIPPSQPADRGMSMPDSLLQLPDTAPVGLRSRWRDRRRLQRIDRLGARLARLDAVDALLGRDIAARRRLGAGRLVHDDRRGGRPAPCRHPPRARRGAERGRLSRRRRRHRGAPRDDHRCRRPAGHRDDVERAARRRQRFSRVGDAPRRHRGTGLRPRAVERRRGPPSGATCSRWSTRRGRR